MHDLDVDLESDAELLDYDAPLGSLGTAWSVTVVMWNVLRVWYAESGLALETAALGVFALLAFGTAVPYARATGRYARVLSARAHGERGSIKRDAAMVTFTILVPYSLLLLAATNLGRTQLIIVLSQVAIVLVALVATVRPRVSPV